MKSNIHPKYTLSTVTCACGHTWQTMSTNANLKTDLCSNCHPFYTGEQRIVDTLGRVERFTRLMANRTSTGGPAVAAKRTSKNRANIAPPPQERKPRPVEGEGDAATTQEAPDTEAAVEA